MPNAVGFANIDQLENRSLVPARVFYGPPATIPGQTALAPAQPLPRFVLKLTDDRQIAVNGQEVALPAGVGRYVRGDAFKVLAQLYANLVLYIVAVGQQARRIKDEDVIELQDGQQFETRQEMPRIASVPRHLTRD